MRMCLCEVVYKRFYVFKCKCSVSPCPVGLAGPMTEANSKLATSPYPLLQLWPQSLELNGHDFNWVQLHQDKSFFLRENAEFTVT